MDLLQICPIPERWLSGKLRERGLDLDHGRVGDTVSLDRPIGRGQCGIERRTQRGIRGWGRVLGAVMGEGGRSDQHVQRNRHDGTHC